MASATTSPSNPRMSGSIAIWHLIRTASIRRGARLTAPRGTAYYAAQREGGFQIGTKTQIRSSRDPSSAPTSDVKIWIVDLPCSLPTGGPRVIVIVIAPTMIA